jgi:two-component system sensor histidine kinase/response regulator
MDKILVVEDEKDVRTTIVDLLENNGYIINSAGDGKQAAKILEYEIPDMIISDIMMPEMDGYQLLEHFQKLPGASTVPFIFLTAKTDITDLRKGMIQGADDYLMKPFRAKELLQAVQAQLEKKKRLDKKFEDIFLDISAYVPHELRTPLIPIIGYADLIREGINDLTKNEICEMAGKIKMSSNRLHKTIEKFIRYTGIRLKLAAKKNNELINSCIKSPGTILEQTGKKMMKDAGRENDLKLELVDSPIKVSENDFQFFIEEILENALKFSEPGTGILIKSRISEKMYELEVTDHGRGMTVEQLTNLAPFSQHERDKFQQAGNGLGLISVKNLVAYYDGVLKLASEVNYFTTCSLSLPVLNNI